MTLTAPKRPEVLGQLPRTGHDWARPFTVTLIAGFIAVGVASITGGPVWVAAMIATTVVAAAAIATFGTRRVQRVRSVDAFTVAISPILGWRTPSRRRVQVLRWSRGWIGSPTRIRLWYLPGINDADLMWHTAIRETAAQRLGVRFTTAKHNKLRGFIDLQLSTATEETGPVDEDLARAEQVISGLFGESLRAETKRNPDGVYEAVVHYGFNPRIAENPRLRSRIEKVFSASLPGRWRAEWDLVADEVRFELRPNIPAIIPHPAPQPPLGTARETYKQLEVPYGVDEDGNTMSWMPVRNPHMIVTGTSGSGKTVVMLGLLFEFAWAGWQIFVNDAKLIEFLGVKTWPNVQIVSADMEEQIRLLHHAHEVMEQRYRLIVTGRASVDDFEPMVLFLDEFADFREELGDWYPEIKQKGDPARPPVLRRLRSVARKGRTARVHFVVGLQRPDAEFLTGEVRDNFSARISMGRLSPQGAMMMWENAGVGVALPRTARGRGTTLDENGQPREFQAYWTPDPRNTGPDKVEDLAIIESLRPERPSHDRMMILEPRVQPHLDGKGGDDPEQPTYNAIATARIVRYDPRTARDAGADFLPAMTEAVDELGATSKSTEVDELEQDRFEGYGEPQTTTLDRLDQGDLVLVDEALDEWGVVEDVEPDLLDEDSIAINYTEFETGDSSTVSLPDSTGVTVRRPINLAR
ncbi:FtsK/SpoIIIE domain-containing protein [Agromyces bauzanensis]